MTAIAVQMLVLRVHRAFLVQCFLDGDPVALVVVVGDIDVIIEVVLALPVFVLSIVPASATTAVIMAIFPPVVAAVVAPVVPAVRVVALVVARPVVIAYIAEQYVGCLLLGIGVLVGDVEQDSTLVGGFLESLSNSFSSCRPLLKWVMTA